MKDMDCYTILYQSKHQMRKKGSLEKFNQKYESQPKDKNNKALDKFIQEILEMGMIEIKYEFPPSVFRRLNKYYIRNRVKIEKQLKEDIKQVLKEKSKGLVK